VGLILAAVQVRRRPAFGWNLKLGDAHRLAFLMDLEGRKLVLDLQGLSCTLGNVDRSLAHGYLLEWCVFALKKDYATPH